MCKTHFTALLARGPRIRVISTAVRVHRADLAAGHSVMAYVLVEFAVNVWWRCPTVRGTQHLYLENVSDWAGCGTYCAGVFSLVYATAALGGWPA